MEKDFIIDDGKVRRCDSNLSKMNVFEFIHYYLFHWNYFRDIFTYIFECLKELINYGLGLIYNLLLLLFTPITLVLCAIIQIKNAKKRCLKNK